MRKILGKISVQPKFLVLIFVTIAAIVILSAMTELLQSRKEMLNLMQNNAHSLLETILSNSQNTLASNETLETELKSRLLNNANFIKILYEQNRISNRFLEEIARQNDIFRINVFNKAGKKIFGSHKETHSGLPEEINPGQVLQPIFNGETDSLIVGIKKSRFTNQGYRFAVAVAAKDRSAIVLNVEADKLLEFRKSIGFGSLLQKMSANPQIHYIIIEDSLNVLAASGDIGNLPSIGESEFLKKAAADSTFRWHILNYKGSDVFEAVHPFYYMNRRVGLMRLGLSLEPLDAINERITRRIIIIGLLLLIFGFAVLALIFARQNLNRLQKRYESIEDYSGKIVNNISDVLLVVDKSRIIKSTNSAVSSVLGINPGDITGKNITEIFPADICGNIFDEVSTINQFDCRIADKLKHLLISKSFFTDETGGENLILLIRDLTEQKMLESQIQMKEKLAAMGELASGVAHEIRNPLNTIGTITQQLSKDFEPKENAEEFKSLSQLVYKEVKRINQTIEEFLKFSRPGPLNPEEFSLVEFLHQIRIQYEAMLQKNSISLKIECAYGESVFWDKKQIQQVFMNLFENSIDACPPGGNISISVLRDHGFLSILFQDNGHGIRKEIMANIFNIYFTTKPKGTGMGLAIIQRIVFEHGGSISVESKENEGTTFIISLPIKISK